MRCPRCQSDEANSSGECPVCGYKATGDAPVSESITAEQNKPDSRNLAGLIEVNYTHPPQSAEEELPLWRQDLSRRLQEIKQRRQSSSEEILQGIAGPKLPFRESREMLIASGKTGLTPDAPNPASIQIESNSPEISQPVPRSAPKRAPVRSARPVRLAPDQSEREISKPATPAPEPKSANIRDLIDHAVTKQPLSPDTAGHMRIRPAGGAAAGFEDKLILLSRTLSGLIDLIIIVLFTGTFIISADALSGIIVLDAVSLVNFSALLFMTHFVYSIFFLGSANQTIGMMITDLKVVTEGRQRPGMRQLFIRCLGYLVSAGLVGIGLVWGFFDRDSLCLHDRWSNTRVVRI
jgi:uncharacterized RDD family membrane protein YckC